MEDIIEINKHFAELEMKKNHKGYFYSVLEVLTIVILGSFCGLRNMNQIHQWACSPRVSDFLKKHFEIYDFPCYYWMLCLLKLINPKSLNRCFTQWVQSFLPNGVENLTLSFDGKTIRSTGKFKKNDKPLHIVSAHIAELGVTFGQTAVEDKSNEIPAVQELLKLLRIEGCLVVADALNCQKETAKVVISGKADYLLSVKDNQETLKKDIEDYVQDSELRKTMDTFETLEKNRGRIERRKGFVTTDIDWLYGKEEWKNLFCIGAIHTQFTNKTGTSDEWHYYISSRNLNAEELLKHARLEWSVETMHWLLDVHFGEDFCRVEDEDVQQNLNMIRKIVLNSIKLYKEKTKFKKAISKIMFDCLLDSENMLPMLNLCENLTQ